MFTFVLGRYVDSLVLILKQCANVTNGADSVKIIGVISVDRCAEIRGAA